MVVTRKVCDKGAPEVQHAKCETGRLDTADKLIQCDSSWKPNVCDDWGNTKYKLKHQPHYCPIDLNF